MREYCKNEKKLSKTWISILNSEKNKINKTKAIFFFNDRIIDQSKRNIYNIFRRYLNSDRRVVLHFEG